MKSIAMMSWPLTFFTMYQHDMTCAVQAYPSNIESFQPGGPRIVKADGSN